MTNTFFAETLVADHIRELRTAAETSRRSRQRRRHANAVVAPFATTSVRTTDFAAEPRTSQAA